MFRYISASKCLNWLVSRCDSHIILIFTILVSLPLWLFLSDLYIFGWNYADFSSVHKIRVCGEKHYLVAAPFCYLHLNSCVWLYWWPNQELCDKIFHPFKWNREKQMFGIERHCSMNKKLCWEIAITHRVTTVQRAKMYLRWDFTACQKYNVFPKATGFVFLFCFRLIKFVVGIGIPWYAKLACEMEKICMNVCVCVTGKNVCSRYLLPLLPT